MRNQHLKLKKGNSTKAERIFAEILKDLQIPFRAKVKIKGREIDFIIGLNAIEINGHDQVPTKNGYLLEEGYTPINIDNQELLDNPEIIKKEIKQLIGWQTKQQG